MVYTAHVHKTMKYIKMELLVLRPTVNANVRQCDINDIETQL